MDAPREVLIGRLAVERGFLKKEELDLVVEEQGRRGAAMPLGELLLELGMLTRLQLDELVEAQKKTLAAPSPYTKDKPYGADLLGKHAIAAGLITQAQLNECIRLQGLAQKRGRPQRLGEVLVERKYLTPEQVKKLMGAQGKRLLRCEKCGAQYNVHGTAPAGLACKACKGKLVEPTKQRNTDLSQVSADGSFYGGESLDLLPETARFVPEVALPPAKYVGYERRVKGKPKGKPWVAIATVAVVLGLVGFLVVASSGHATPPKRVEEASTPTVPAPPGPSVPTSVEPSAPGKSGPSQVVEALQGWLREHASDLPACAQHLRQVQSASLGSSDEAEVARIVKAFEDRVRPIGEAPYQERINAASMDEGRRKFGPAHEALSDLPIDKDPLGYWNAKLVDDRRGVLNRAWELWTSISRQARDLASQGMRNEAMTLIAGVREFGLPDIDLAADALSREIPQIAAGAPAPEGAAAPAPAGGATSIPLAAGTIEEAIASLAAPAPDAKQVDCPLCSDLKVRKHTCPSCNGEKHVACPSCTGKGVVACPNTMHTAEGPLTSDNTAADESVGKWQTDWQKNCKYCSNKREVPCKFCGGKKVFPCSPCKSTGVVEWKCLLSGERAKVAAQPSGTCWVCDGKGAAQCPSCRGSGKESAKPRCQWCRGLGQRPCSKCAGRSTGVCGQCNGRGYTKTYDTVLTNDPDDPNYHNSNVPPGRQTCQRCNGKAAIDCSECKSGMVPCTECPKEVGACPACEGGGRVDPCPACCGGTLWWARTTDGAVVFLAPLAELCPMADRCLRGPLGAGKTSTGNSIAWYVLVVDDSKGGMPVAWTGKVPAVTLRGAGWSFADPLKLLASTPVVDRLGEELAMIGLGPYATRGGEVGKGHVALFLLAASGGAPPAGDVTIESVDRTDSLALTRATLTGPLRSFLLSCFWTKDATSR